MDRVGNYGKMSQGNAEEIQVQWKYYWNWVHTPVPCFKGASCHSSNLLPTGIYCISGCIAFTGTENKASVNYLHLHFCVWVVFFKDVLMFIREAKCFLQYLCGCCLVFKI